MTAFITKEMLENCIVNLAENYNLCYEYTASGINISVARIDDGVLTFVLNDFIPYPTKDEIQ